MKLSPADFASFDDYVEAVRLEAARRVIAAKNKLRARKGLPLLDPDTGREIPARAAPDPTAAAPVLAGGLPASPPAAWRVPRYSARAYCALAASKDGLTLAEIGRAIYRDGPVNASTLNVHVSTLRAALRKAGFVLPPVRGGRVARPYRIGSKTQ